MPPPPPSAPPLPPPPFPTTPTSWEGRRDRTGTGWAGVRGMGIVHGGGGRLWPVCHYFPQEEEGRWRHGMHSGLPLLLFALLPFYPLPLTRLPTLLPSCYHPDFPYTHTPLPLPPALCLHRAFSSLLCLIFGDQGRRRISMAGGPAGGGDRSWENQCFIVLGEKVMGHNLSAHPPGSRQQPCTHLLSLRARACCALLCAKAYAHARAAP